MPTYQYSCRTCGYQEDIVCRIADRPESYICPLECGGDMKQDITIGIIQCDDAVNVPWLREFSHAHTRFAGSRKERARDGGPPIKTRTEYKRYLERNDLRPDAPGISQDHD